MDQSREMITFQQACSKIVESEEQLMEDLYTLIQVYIHCTQSCNCGSPLNWTPLGQIQVS